MPLGITVTGDVFQRKLDECFGHIKNVTIIANDIMVIGKNRNHKDHDLAFTLLLKMAKECNVKLNYQKLQYKCTEVNFYGETYMTDGHKPAQSKVNAIVQIPSPKSKKEVQSFIGMISYLSKFSPRLTELAEPLRELVKEKVPFNWSPEHEESFAMLKKEIIKAPVLAYYNPQKETVLQTDASTKGLGACLLQEEKPVYFARTTNRCKYKGLRSLSLTRGETCMLCQQSTDRDTEGIRILCSSMGSQKVPSLPIWMPLYALN